MLFCMEFLARKFLYLLFTAVSYARRLYSHMIYDFDVLNMRGERETKALNEKFVIE